jgi:hypothetical protein
MQKSNYIKLIAMITMLIDHIGFIIFPDQIIFRVIGRIAFPLFAYQLCVGYFYTKNIKNHIVRMFTFGIGIQLFLSIFIYFFKINQDLGYFNIFFTLTLGLLAIYFYDNKKYFSLFLVLIIPLLLEHLGITLDYGLYGIAMILALYVFYIKIKSTILIISAIALSSLVYCFSVNDYLQLYCLLSIFFIIKPLSLNLRIPKYFFYWFYPAHLAVLHIINIVLK